jgi:hypothetical protein
MSDPFESEFSALRAATGFEPPDPAAVRRRGDRLRRRSNALKAGGAALTLTLLATPLLSLNRHGAPVEPPVVDHGLVAGDALSPTDLPRRPELGAWKQTRATDAALACVPARAVDGLGASETLQRRYGAHRGGSTAGGPYAAQVRETVLAFADPAAAKAATTAVSRRLRADCAATDLANPDPLESRAIAGPGRGLWELYVRRADQVCTECDAVFFDRQAVVRVGDRVVLLSLSELGGPSQPKGLRAAMLRLTTRAAVRAAAPGQTAGTTGSG